MAIEHSGHIFPPTRFGPPSRYPWHEWLNGSTWALVPGEDFRTNIDSMRKGIYRAAAKRGKTVRVSVFAGENLIHLKASDK